MLVQHLVNIIIATHNQPLQAAQKIFLSCKPIGEIQENLHLGKITHYALTTLPLNDALNTKQVEKTCIFHMISGWL